MHRLDTETKITDLNSEVESLKLKLTQHRETESNEVNTIRKTLQLLEEDREKLLSTVDPLMKTNKDLQESLEGLANELQQKKNEIKKLQASSVNVKREMEIEAVAIETKVDDVRKEFDTEMKEVKKHHKKELAKVRVMVRHMCWSDKAIIVFLNSSFKLLMSVLYARIIIIMDAQTWRICVCSNQPYPGIFNLFLTEKSLKADTGNKLNIKTTIKNIRGMLKSL